MAQLNDDLKDGILNSQSDGINWTAIVEWMADEFQDVIDAGLYLLAMTWLDTAEGVWLDRIGDLVGLKRPGNEELVRIFRTRATTDPVYDPDHGFANASGTIGGYLGGRWGITTDGLVDDDTYRDLLRCKIAATNADASVPGIARFVYNSFGLTCTVVANPRQVLIELDGTFDLRQRRYIETYAPIVAGVDCRVINFPS